MMQDELVSLAEYLKRRGVPVSLTNEETKINRLKEKIDKVIDAMTNDKNRVVLLHGTDSPYKYAMAVEILKHFALQNKSVYYMSAIAIVDSTYEKSAVYAITGIESITGFNIAKVKDTIRAMATSGKIIIMCCTDISKVDEIYGKDFMDFMSHISIIVDVSVERNEMELI